MPAFHLVVPSAADVVVGGHSYGGRVASLAAAEPEAPYAALVLFSYPLHPPGQPERTDARIAHWPDIRCPVLLLSGESDPFARIELLRSNVKRLPNAELVTYPRLGHTLKPVLDDVLDRVARFLEPLSALDRPSILSPPQASKRTPIRVGTDTRWSDSPARPCRGSRSSRPQPTFDVPRLVVPVGRSRDCECAQAAGARSWSPSCRRSSSSVSAGASVTAAKAPPGLKAFMAAVGQVESGGRYTARNPNSGRLRQVPDHAVELALVGGPLPRQLQCQADAGQPGEGRRREVHLALQVARQLAPRRLLVADRVEAHLRLVDVRDALRQPGHAPVQAAGGTERASRHQLEPGSATATASA